MRKSREVPLTLLAALAAFSLTGCRPQHRDCVDSVGRKLTDGVCELDQRDSHYVPGAHYIYGGSSGGHLGDTVIGGSVSRGGFGSIGGSGSHGGGGE